MLTEFDPARGLRCPQRCGSYFEEWEDLEAHVAVRWEGIAGERKKVCDCPVLMVRLERVNDSASRHPSGRGITEAPGNSKAPGDD